MHINFRQRSYFGNDTVAETGIEPKKEDEPAIKHTDYQLPETVFALAQTLLVW